MSTLNPPAPRLSLRERDRRWQAIRGILTERELDCLLVGSFRGRDRYNNYILDDFVEGVVVFPREGQPHTQTWSTVRLSRALVSIARGAEPWGGDYRVGDGSAATARLLREMGFERGRIGAVGLESTTYGEPHGFLPYTFWDNLVRELPGASFSDVSRPFAELALVKSEAEQALLRHAAQIAEAACQAMLDVTRPGVGEETIYAEIMHEILRHAADARYPALILQSGSQNLGWGPPRWLARAEPPRRVQAGDLVQAGIFCCYGGQEVEVQMAVALDPVDAENARCEAVARRSYEAGLGVLRPGIAFAELVQAMEAPLREAGCWAKTPLCRTIGWAATGHTRVNLEDLAGTEEGALEGAADRGVVGGDLVLRPGMTLALSPNACSGPHRVTLGGSVLVTEASREELNALPTRVMHVA